MNGSSEKVAQVALSECQIRWQEGKHLTLPSICLTAGESLGVMGPSGCGKSTWLRWLLGVEQAYVTVKGELSIDGQQVHQLPIEQRGVGLVMQEQALFPYYSVAQNLSFALAQQKLSRHQQRTLIEEKLALIGLSGYQSRMPEQLSGGERARVALLRAVLAQPKLILLDEPFNGLDKARREQMCHWTYEFLRQHRIAAIIVSHDQSDLVNANQLLQWPQEELTHAIEASI